MATDKRFFGLTAEEVAAGIIDSSLYIKAGAIAEGDEKKARAIYIALRAEELQKLHRREQISGAAKAAAGTGAAVVGGLAQAATSESVKKGAAATWSFLKTAIVLVVTFIAIAFGGSIGRSLMTSGEAKPTPSVSSSARSVNDSSRLASEIRNSPDDSAIELLRQAATRINQQAPIKIDEITRLDRAYVGPGRKLTYEFTLLVPQVAAEEWREEQVSLRNRILGARCGEKYFLKDGASIDYVYRDTGWRYVGKVSFSPGDCDRLATQTVIASPSVAPTASGERKTAASKSVPVAINPSTSYAENEKSAGQREYERVMERIKAAEASQEKSVASCALNEKRVSNWRTGGTKCVAPGDPEYR